MNNIVGIMCYFASCDKEHEPMLLTTGRELHCSSSMAMRHRFNITIRLSLLPVNQDRKKYTHIFYYHLYLKALIFSWQSTLFFAQG